MEIRRAETLDLEEIMELYARARKFQAEHGNPNQWAGGYPQEEVLREDLRQGRLYVVYADMRLAGVFMFTLEPEPDYAVIREGAWLNSAPYGTLHRVASAGICRGVGKVCIDWAFARCGNLRIDTHEDNTVMQSLLKKNGFQYCGRVTIRNGEERLAYQKL